MNRLKVALVAGVVVALLQLGCGGVRIGQTPEEAAAERPPTASEPPEDERDRKSEPGPLVTGDIEPAPPGAPPPEGTTPEGSRRGQQP